MKRSQNYHKAFIICHGKSEQILTKSLKSNLRLPIVIYPKKNMSSSIQITGLKQLFNQRDFRTIDEFLSFHNLNVEKTKDNLHNFQIFIIMDTDDVPTKDILMNYKSKSMFKDHPLYDYITPIFNTPDLDQVLISLGFKIDTKNKVKSYKKVFPANNDDIEAFKLLLNKLQRTNNSNFFILLNYLNNFIDQI